MLSRYQKAGGFMQILALIETCGKTKQENFLSMIEKEDPRWANAIKQKMLTIDKILACDDNTIAEIFSRINEITIATALHGFKPEHWERISKTFSHSYKRKIDDLKNSKIANAAEVTSAFVKIINDVRAMVKEGYLKLEKISPDMAIEDGIEEKIGKSLPNTDATGEAPTAAPNMEGFGAPAGAAPTGTANHANGNGHGHGHGPAEHGPEVKELRHKVQSLHHENTLLKNELKVIKEKLGQIKKLAA